MSLRKILTRDDILGIIINEKRNMESPFCGNLFLYLADRERSETENIRIKD